MEIRYVVSLLNTIQEDYMGNGKFKLSVTAYAKVVHALHCSHFLIMQPKTYHVKLHQPSHHYVRNIE